MNNLIEALNSNFNSNSSSHRASNRVPTPATPFSFSVNSRKTAFHLHRKKNNFYVSIVLSLKKPKSYF